MYINNKSLKSYDARLLNRTILPSTFEVRAFWGRNSLSPIINNNVKRRYKKLLLEIEFKGSPELIETNKSRLIKDITISTMRFNSLPHIYEGNVSTIELMSKVSGYESHSIDVNVLELEDERVLEFNNEIKVFLSNTDITPCILELKSTVSASNVLVTGLSDDIKIKSITPNKTIRIDGINGLVLEDGLNNWLNYDSWGFPKLHPGENNINISNANVSAKLVYKARWL